MRAHVGLVLELARQEHIVATVCVLLGHLHRTDKPTLFLRNRHDLGPQAGDQLLALGAHPVRHVDAHLVAEGSPEGRERDTGVATARLDDRIAGVQPASRLSFRQDVTRHSVLDRTRHVQRLVLRIDPTFVAILAIRDFQQGRVPHHLAERCNGPGRCSN